MVGLGDYGRLDDRSVYANSNLRRAINQNLLQFPRSSCKRCSVKRVFLEISPWAYNFIKKEALAQVFSWGFCEISKNTFSYRTPLVAVSCFPQQENWLITFPKNILMFSLGLKLSPYVVIF